MGTISEQHQLVASSTINSRNRYLGRTQRKIYVRERDKELSKSTKEYEDKKALFEDAKQKVSNMTLAQYKNYYQELPNWMKDLFASPQEIETAQQETVNTNTSKADKQIKE